MLALNRAAIVVRPKPPFLEWLHAVDPTSASLTLTNLAPEPTIYLVVRVRRPRRRRGAGLQAGCARPSLRISSTAGGAIGPHGRRYGRCPFFRRWFDCQFHSMVLDLADGPLIQEEI